MSRSYKKNLGGRITCAISDKKDKQIWHRQARRNIRQQTLRAGMDNEFDEAFLTYDDASHADLWGWDSDGGSYLQYTDKQVVEKFNSELNSGEMWKDYKKEKGVLSVWWFGRLVKQCFDKKFGNEEDFNDFVMKNSSKIIDIWKRLNYGK